MKASDIRQIRDLYEESADAYAVMMETEIQSPVYADTLSRLSDRLEDKSGPLIDTSCGSGHMLALYHDRYDPDRELWGVDLVPRMVEIARSNLPSSAHIQSGDMRRLTKIVDNSVAAVLSFFSLHHLDTSGVQQALGEWHRILKPGGQLVLATWEGTGKIDYGHASDIVAYKYPAGQIRSAVEAAHFTTDRRRTESVDEMGMDALYLEATRQ